MILQWLQLEGCESKMEMDRDIHHFPCGLAIAQELEAQAIDENACGLAREAHRGHHYEYHPNEEDYSLHERVGADHIIEAIWCEH